jgi:hypothetical protein
MVYVMVGSYSVSCVGASVPRQGLALLIEPNRVGFYLKTGTEPISETLCFKLKKKKKDRTMDNVQKHNNFIRKVG